MGGTHTDDAGEVHDPAQIVATLTRVIAAHAPATPAACHALRAGDVVELGRGGGAGSRRASGRLEISLADARVSEVHARMCAQAGVWEIEDLGAKNGVIVNGGRVARTLLSDGDTIEIGRTVFRFDAAVDWGDGEALDLAPAEPLPGMRTVVPSLARTFGQLATIAESPTPVVVLGPTGSGKERVARGLHERSGRSGELVAVNCATLRGELIDSTLFGHRRGAFTGATEDHLGLVRAADRGTLFLDEVADLPQPTQAMLLRVLQEREVVPVGTTRAVAVDVRVVVATHRDLRALVAAGAFRADLWHRLRGFTVALPPLAERSGDLGVVIAELLARHAAGRRVELQPRAVRALLAYAWPGNVRELEQTMITALALARDQMIDLAHLPAELAAVPSARRHDEGVTRAALVALLEEHDGNVRAIARAVGKDPVQVRRWLRRFALDAAGYRRS